ncbi:acyl-CoA dehydrogenase/oxidase [Hyaloraphidium curvatum]|nr:acyl-CoA dehydrogenase/oxidase [Hyaloraphidium curvatum]
MALVPGPVDPAWRQAWAAHVADIRSDVPFEEGAARMRQVVRSKLLLHTDIYSDPAKFFEAHRLIVDPLKRGPGSGIRLTVHFNLFAGTVLGLGGPEHAEVLKGMQDRGELGCFALTERFAGVNSGLVVNTTATWLPEKQCFVLHCPDDGAVKNWISQALTSTKAAVVADLRVAGKSYGPHAFLVDLRNKDGHLAQGITMGDMGIKTTGNDLDNAWVRFDGAEVPKSALLNRFADIRDDKYVQTTKERMRIEIIGGRLLTGRVAIAQASLVFARKLFESTRRFASGKQCWIPGGRVPLGRVPHIAAVLAEADKKLGRMDAYMAAVEAALSKCLVAGKIPDARLVEAIAVGKIAAVETAIALCDELKHEVGSYALMAGTGFEHLEFLTMCKFAEGDSRILAIKIARDRLRGFQHAKVDKEGAGKGAETEEDRLCAKIASAGKDGFEREYKTVFALAESVIERTITEWTVWPAKAKI